MLPLTLPCLPSPPSSHSNLNHNPENNTGRLKTTQNLCNEHSSSTPKKKVGGRQITQKKIKKPENKKVEPTSAAIQKPRSAKTKRKIRQRTHAHSPPSDDDDDRLPTQRASDDTDPRHPMTRLGSLNPGLGNGR